MAKQDEFARIAAMGINNAGKGLIEPDPPVLEEKLLRAEQLKEHAVFTPQEKIQDKEKLYEEVERQKEYYRPFFEDYAPALEEKRQRRYLHEFQWRIKTTEDETDFPGALEGKRAWENITIPHFGEPRGVTATYYRTEFSLEEWSEEESIWITFRGVDYKAHVFVNGAYLGSHEGFFAPFEFDLTAQAKAGMNVLLVVVENDYIHMGSCSSRNGEEYTGDKFYAATGPGYDEPYEGWHHCPPGMGIYQDVYVERRSRLFLSDSFVRPVDECSVEVWLEVFGCDVGHQKITVDVSVYGQNFKDTQVEHLTYEPCTGLEIGLGDSLTEAKMKAAGRLGGGTPMYMERGINYLKIPVSMKDARRWELKEPWLYQAQLRLLDENGVCLDTGRSQFGMRSFRLDESGSPKGRFYLNDRQLRLRGANSMGFEQQCVMKEDWEQLYNDLILAKVCNMNFIRLTQRPVQEEVYDFCDKIGLMLQTDLPAFGAIRRNQFAEGIRQSQEMEHLIRSHPSAVMVTYINEPMPNAKNMPHRSLTRPELESFFSCADLAVRILNPDRVIKHVDGDYDPPTKGLPDNHCYPCWYNGHGIDIGRLHKGYWMKVKDGWNYGCGEYGIEGLEDVSVMKKYYPHGWLPADEAEEVNWTPNRLPGAQVGSFHYFFYDTKHSLEDWVRESQKYQAEAVKMMTEAYRRDNRMVTFAYHLFIDAFPEGWMKTLMDVDRNPKQAFFAYREALTPVMVNLRTDRFKLFAGEEVKVECWLCNDAEALPAGCKIRYQILEEQQIRYADETEAAVDMCESRFQGFITFSAPQVKTRTAYRVQAALMNPEGEMMHSTELPLELFPEKRTCRADVCFLGEKKGHLEAFAEELSWNDIPLERVGKGDRIIVADYEAFLAREEEVLSRVEAGAVLLLLELQEGNYRIGGSLVHVKNASMLPLHFASRDTGHELVRGMKPDDIRFWYDEEAGYITPLLESTFTSDSFREILTSGNQDDSGNWQKVMAAGEMRLEQGRIYICQVKLPGRISANPTARELILGMLEGREKNS